MQVAIAVPHRPAQNSGNDVTAQRWATRLAELGHHSSLVVVVEGDDLDRTASDELWGADLLIVLHARRSAVAAKWWRRNRGASPMVVALAGTDLYVDLPGDTDTASTVEAADHLIVLQEAGVARLDELVPGSRSRTTVVHQSVDVELPTRTQPTEEFRVVVLAHLREVKDPLMAARAARRLPPESRVSVHHGGAAHDAAWRSAAESEAASNPRYHWHGGLSRDDALQLLAGATVLACTSRFEGGANVVTEAIALGVPVVGTRIDGNTGLLGAGYPALVEVGDDAAFARLLTALENDPAAYADLQRRIDDRHSIAEPHTERTALGQVLAALT